MPKLFVGLILVVVLSVVGLALVNASMSQYLTAFIALAALVVSVVSAFKEDIFPFRPIVLFEEVLLAAPTGPPHDSPAILLPVVFVNKGHGLREAHIVDGDGYIWVPDVAVRAESGGQM